MDLGEVQLGSVVPLAMFSQPHLICHELVQYFKVATFPFKDDCTAAHVLRSSATNFSIVIQDYTYLKKGFYRNCRAHEEVNIIIRTDDIVAEK